MDDVIRRSLNLQEYHGLIKKNLTKTGFGAIFDELLTVVIGSHLARGCSIVLHVDDILLIAPYCKLVNVDSQILSLSFIPKVMQSAYRPL